jgi:hypothetical protein
VATKASGGSEEIHDGVADARFPCYESTVTLSLSETALAYLLEALCYNTEGRGFDSFQPHYVPGVDAVSNRNEYQESSCG